MKENIEITVPTSWNEITLDKFEDIIGIYSDKDLDLNQKEIKILAVLTGLSTEQIRSMSVGSYRKLLSTISFMKDPVEKRIPQDLIEIAGKRYHADIFPGNFTAAQFIDYKTIIEEDIDRKTARLLACFIYPEGSKYNDGSYSVDDIVDILNKNMKVPEVTAYTDFFILQWSAWSGAILEYSEKTLTKDPTISRDEKLKLKKSLTNARHTIQNIGK